MRPAHILPRIHLPRPGADVLTVSCGLMILAQVVVAARGGFPAAMPLFEEFGLSREGILSGRIWQLGTHVFLHGTWLHLILNLLVIYPIGGWVLHVLGGRGFAKIFWGGVLLGSLLHLLLHPVQPLGSGPEEIHNAPLVGASAGAMALILALTGLSPASRVWLLPVSGKNLGRGMLLASLLLFLATPGLGLPGFSAIGRWIVAAGGAQVFQLGHLYHLGGGLMGWFYVKRLLRHPVSLEELRRRRARREKLAA